MQRKRKPAADDTKKDVEDALKSTTPFVTDAAETKPAADDTKKDVDVN